MTPAIDINDLTYIYPNRLKALDNLSLQIDRGEIFGLLGLNGAGKTTVIKIITTLMRVQYGTVKVLGYNVLKDPQNIKRRIGVVTQENNLDEYLNTRQNLIYQCRYFGLRKGAYLKEVDSWIEDMGLKEKRDEQLYHLSGGTKRKVMIARAFLTRPDLLILDEPTTSLDPEVRAFVWEKIRGFRGSGRTVFLSTHYLEEAERLCDRIGIINKGKLVVIGKPDELKEKVREKGLINDPNIEDIFHDAIQKDRPGSLRNR